MYKLSPFFTVGSPANPIEVAIFPVGVGVAAVGDAVGDAMRLATA